MSWEAVVGVLETLKRERWGKFVDRHGDPGRDVALWLGAERTNLTLRELGERVGIGAPATSQAVSRVRQAVAGGSSELARQAEEELRRRSGEMSRVREEEAGSS